MAPRVRVLLLCSPRVGTGQLRVRGSLAAWNSCKGVCGWTGLGQQPWSKSKSNKGGDWESRVLDWSVCMLKLVHRCFYPRIWLVTSGRSSRPRDNRGQIAKHRNYKARLSDGHRAVVKGNVLAAGWGLKPHCQTVRGLELPP